MTNKSGLSHVMCDRPLFRLKGLEDLEAAQSRICLLNAMVGHRFCFYVERIGRNCLFVAGLGVDSQAHLLSANHVRHVGMCNPEPRRFDSNPLRLRDSSFLES
ncbi:MAG: hypothetical protein JWR14_2452 [Caballeronia sp.]|nr:hypothetical protein [Caballeronia sp.]